MPQVFEGPPAVGDNHAGYNYSINAVCILIVAVVRCDAGIEAGHDTGNSVGDSSGGYHYSAPITGGDFSGQDHGFSASQGDQGHDFSGGQGHDFSGGQSAEISGGHGNDYTLALTQGGQDFHGPQHFLGGVGLGSYGGDSYLQAAHDFGSQNFNGDGHGDVSGAGDSSHEEQGQGNHGQQDFGHGQQDFGQQGQHDFGQGHQGFILQDGGHEYGDQHDFGNVHAFPVGEHVDEEHPVQVPLYKHMTYPIPKLIHVNVPKPILVGVPQPYPVKVPVHKPVAVPVETEISIPIEKVVPYPVVKHVPYPVEKHVPIRVEKTVTVHVPQPYPVKIPVYKTIHHKGHH
ncbi:uncharacterized protein LOC121728086 [Aricia agestis]|uniref:uncharacterized protein LOC121728086 n=1 Tax=Aricia agestis TaxID=91739 RepID=UPI001C2090C2|nr:uncharacterized protein LOC121728086 [Aricia agestis]